MIGELLGLGASLFSARSARDANQQNIDLAREASQFNAQQAQLNRDFEANQAQKQMDYQERMSNSAHQREVKDLIAAGLNPLLSVNSGASSPVGAMAGGSSASAVAGHVENPFKDMPANLANSARVAMEFRLNKEAVKTAQSQQGLNSAQAAQAVANARLADAQAMRVSGGSFKSPFFDLPIFTAKDLLRRGAVYLKSKFGPKG